jgi:hypothetical protein
MPDLVREPGPWLAVALLGAFHGINPAMGWRFAVALGLQRRRRRVLLWSLLPLAVGHEASVAAVVLVGALAGMALSPDPLRPVAAAALLAFGALKLLRPRAHPRWVGMRVSPRDLVLWSFLMATAHGAGLMLLPVLFGAGGAAAAGTAHTHADGRVHVHLLEGGPLGLALAQDTAAVALHTLAMLAAMTAVAGLVYDRLGVAVLRRSWVNFDAVWAVAVLVAGVFTLFT